MKRKVPLIFLLFITTSSFASTNVPNSLSGDNQWNSDGNPYIVQGKVVVPKGVTLRIGPNVKVVFQGASALEVDGTLDVTGSAAAPVVFDMTQGGLQSEVFLNGADADISNAKFLSGVFLAQDSNLHLQWFEMTKGSGLYLRGTTTAVVKNGKIYGNATGIVLDGKTKATLEFNTLTQNSYGLYLKSYSELEFKNNSVHDNDKEVVNSTPAVNLGGNYWGTTDAQTVTPKLQGPVNIGPVVSLKDLLRVYIKTQLPEITKEMSVALVKKEKRQAVEMAKKAKEQKAATVAAQAPATPPPAPVAEAPAPPPPPAASAQANVPETTAPEAASLATPETAAAPAPVEETGVVKTVQVKQLPPAPHKLEPLSLPPDQGDLAEEPPSAPPANAENPVVSTTPPSPGNETAPPAPPAAPEVPLPPSTTAGTEVSPPPPASSETAPPIPPEVTGSSSPATETGVPSAPPVPPAADVIAPPDIETSTTPPPPPVTTGNNTPAASTSPQSVPTPPELNEQVPPTPPEVEAAPSAVSTPTSAPPASQPTTNATSPPPPPAVPSAFSEQSNTAPSAESPALQLGTEPTENQQKAVKSLDGVNGDIDGMQPPPLDIDVPASSAPDVPAIPSANGAQTQKSNDSGVVLPPIKDSDVAPPKDLDLPPTDDLGNVNLDSKNK